MKKIRESYESDMAAMNVSNFKKKKIKIWMNHFFKGEIWSNFVPVNINVTGFFKSDVDGLLMFLAFKYTGQTWPLNRPRVGEVGIFWQVLESPGYFLWLGFT